MSPPLVFYSEKTRLLLGIREGSLPAYFSSRHVYGPASFYSGPGEPPCLRGPSFTASPCCFCTAFCVFQSLISDACAGVESLRLGLGLTHGFIPLAVHGVGRRTVACPYLGLGKLILVLYRDPGVVTEMPVRTQLSVPGEMC